MKWGLAALYPPCENCEAPSKNFVCDLCFEILRFQKACRICGRSPIPEKMRECLPCEFEPRPYSEVYTSFIYADGIQKFLRDIKDHLKPERFEEIKSEHLPALNKQYDFLIPLSSDPVQSRRRLFDPAQVLAERLSKLWKIPVLSAVFERKPFLKHQRELNREARQRYLKQVVSLSSSYKDFSFGRILLVDDIATTGATLRHHSSLIAEQAEAMDFYCFARALKSPDRSR